MLGLALVGCIGTDLVEELPTLEPRIDITPVVAAVEQGNTVLFEASVYDGFGMKVPNASVQWESSNASVASVDATGLVSALEVGQTMILAHGEEASSMPALLTVVADPTGVALVVVTPDTLMLPIGTTQTFTAMAFNLNGEPLEGKSFTWNSANPETASIDADGTARGLEAGTTDITATTDGIVSPPAYLIVPDKVEQILVHLGLRSPTTNGTTNGITYPPLALESREPVERFGAASVVLEKINRLGDFRIGLSEGLPAIGHGRAHQVAAGSTQVPGDRAELFRALLPR